MTRLLKITDLGSGIMVQGTNNVLYPDNATLTYPYNSIIVVTDESNIATFRSASNNDVLFSGLIGKIEIGGEIVTKENINTKFDAIANKESGGGGSFADASYDSQTKRINFYDNGGNIVSYIDATGFIKDGMVSNVAISDGNLVITFNTDAGQEPISIALTDIFNSENYYNKTEVDGKLAICEYGDWVEKSDAFLSGHWYAIIFVSPTPTYKFYLRINDGSLVNIGVKAANNIITYTDGNGNVIEKPSYIPSASYFDSTTNKFYVYLTDGFIDYLPNVSKYSLKLAESKSCEDIKDYAIGLNSEVDTKANIEDVYDKTTADNTFATQVVVNEEIAARIQGDSAINTALQSKADKTELVPLATKEEVNAAVSAINSKDEAQDAEIALKAVKADVDAALALKADKSEIPDTSEFITKEEYNPKELATAKALTQLNETKADKTELPDVSTFATKTELNAKQDALVSGTNIKTINNQNILGEGNITIEGGMDEDTELLISSALVDLNDRKIDATEVKENYQMKGDYATNAKVDTKANISDVPTNEDYEEAQKITSWSLNDLNARFGGVRLQIITQSAYDALETKDSSTVYFIND